MSFKAKTVLNKDIRVFKQDIDTMEDGLEAIKKFIREKYAIEGGFTIQYEDEEKDVITIASSEDLEEAYNQAEANGTVLKLLVVLDNSNVPIYEFTSELDKSALNNEQGVNTSSSDEEEEEVDKDEKNEQGKEEEENPCNIGKKLLKDLIENESFRKDFINFIQSFIKLLQENIVKYSHEALIQSLSNHENIAQHPSIKKLTELFPLLVNQFEPLLVLINNIDVENIGTWINMIIEFLSHIDLDNNNPHSWFGNFLPMIFGNFNANPWFGGFPFNMPPPPPPPHPYGPFWFGHGHRNGPHQHPHPHPHPHHGSFTPYGPFMPPTPPPGPFGFGPFGSFGGHPFAHHGPHSHHGHSHHFGKPHCFGRNRKNKCHKKENNENNNNNLNECPFKKNKYGEWKKFHCGKWKQFMMNNNIEKEEEKEENNYKKNKDYSVKILNEDVTLMDKAYILPGQVVIKTWQVINDGKKNWPNGIKLKYFGKTFNPIINGVEFNVPELKIGEKGDISVMIETPQIEDQIFGKQKALFRLHLPNNEGTFGPKFRIRVIIIDSNNNNNNNNNENIEQDEKENNVKVEEEKKNNENEINDVIEKLKEKQINENLNIKSDKHESSPSSFADINLPKIEDLNIDEDHYQEPLPEKPQPQFEQVVVNNNEQPIMESNIKVDEKPVFYIYEKELTQLLSMGFNDVERIRYLLDANKGNIDAVINQLFA